MKSRPTVQSLWKIQEETLRRQGAKEHQVGEMRKAYYVGFWNALTHLRDDIGDADLPEEQGVQRLQSLIDECEEFIQTCSRPSRAS
jgi:hypothetical protein